MRPAARIEAAIAVMTDIATRHRPASAALADWGKAHRYAGSGDRAAIGNLVYDALRHRQSAAHVIGAASPRALVLGALHVSDGLDVDAIAALCDGGAHAPATLSETERRTLARAGERPMPPHVAADIPEWLFTRFEAEFGANAIAEGRALARRAPVDLRVNTLQSDRATVLAALSKFGATATQVSTNGIRIEAPAGSKRLPNVEAEVAHGKGWFEVQDEGSQIAAALTGVRPGETVLDLCAGAGGKTLAMAAAMRNQGRIYAYDDDKVRLRPIFERLTRAGALNVEVISAGDTGALAALGDRFDCVLVDAPCSGAGTWRRKPDAKWRLKPSSLAARQDEQRAVLATAARHVKPGGRLVYVTCSLLPEENTAQVAAFLAASRDFALVPTAEAWRNAAPGALAATPPASADGATDTLLLTPARHATDGFFVAVMRRRG
jgi:16S rRNA (cytosine967-C5)-methyltransferase